MLHAYKKKFYGINKFCFYSSVLITIAFVHQSPGDLLTGRSHWLIGTHLNEVHWFMYRKVSKLQDAYWQKRHLWDFSTFFFCNIYFDAPNFCLLWGKILPSSDISFINLWDIYKFWWRPRKLDFFSKVWLNHKHTISLTQ